jgi:hypothetical protein
MGATTNARPKAIKAMLDAGVSLAHVARRLNVTRQGIYAALSRAGLARSGEV